MRSLPHKDRANAHSGAFFSVLIFCAYLLTACAHTGSSAYEGRWTLTALEGKQQILEIRAMESGDYYIYHPDSHLSGDYVRDGDQLIMEQPNNPRAEGFVLGIINKNHLRIIEAPPVRLTGKRYMGADLRRDKNDDGE